MIIIIELNYESLNMCNKIKNIKSVRDYTKMNE